MRKSRRRAACEPIAEGGVNAADRPVSDSHTARRPPRHPGQTDTQRHVRTHQTYTEVQTTSRRLPGIRDRRPLTWWARRAACRPPRPWRAAPSPTARAAGPPHPPPWCATRLGLGLGLGLGASPSPNPDPNPNQVVTSLTTCVLTDITQYKVSPTPTSPLYLPHPPPCISPISPLYHAGQVRAQPAARGLRPPAQEDPVRRRRRGRRRRRRHRRRERQ